LSASDRARRCHLEKAAKKIRANLRLVCGRSTIT
jgi:hypothetical protein